MNNKDDQKLDTLSSRLVYALHLTGTRKADLARAINVQPQVIQFLCSSKTLSSRFTFEISTALGLNTKWLATGEGEMFLADDPKHQLYNEYQRAPLVNNDIILSSLNNDGDFRFSSANQWHAVKSKKENIVCKKIDDTSMEPCLPLNSIVFLQTVKNYNPTDGDIVLVVSKKTHAVLIRKIRLSKSETYLCPTNDELFKQVKLSNSFQVIGQAIECHVNLRRETNAESDPAH